MGPSVRKNRQAFAAWRKELDASLSPEEALAVIDCAWAAPRAGDRRWLDVLLQPEQAPLWADDAARATVPLAWRLLTHTLGVNTWPVVPANLGVDSSWKTVDVLVARACRHAPCGNPGWFPVWVREGATPGHPLAHLAHVANLALKPVPSVSPPITLAAPVLRAWFRDHATALWRGADAPEWIPLWNQIEVETDAALCNPTTSPPPSGFVARGWPHLAAIALYMAPDRVPGVARKAVAAGAWKALNAPEIRDTWYANQEAERQAFETLIAWGYDPPTVTWEFDPSVVVAAWEHNPPARAAARLAAFQTFRKAMKTASSLRQTWKRGP